MTTPPPPVTPPGWHQVGDVLRYWDGSTWTHMAPLAAPPVVPAVRPGAWEPPKTNHVLHLILTLVTCGLWGIVWALVAFSHRQVRRDEQGRPIPISTRRQAVISVTAAVVMVSVGGVTAYDRWQEHQQEEAVTSACREQLTAVGITSQVVSSWHIGSRWTVTEQVTTAAGPAQWVCHAVLDGSTARVTDAGPT